MEKNERIKSELIAILSLKNGIQTVLYKIEKRLPKEKENIEAFLNLETDIINLSGDKGFDALSQQSKRTILNKLIAFLEEFEIVEGEQGQTSKPRQSGPATSKPPSVTRKESNAKANLATITATLVVIGLSLSLVYFFSLKVWCDQQWEKAQKTNTCYSYQYFVSNCENCPQFVKGQLKIKELCQN
jgi:hypothetical protein